jgi:hypothetical protein
MAGRMKFASVGGSTLAVPLGNGNGSFQPRQDYFAGSLSNWIAAADFNGDGLSETVTALPPS